MSALMRLNSTSDILSFIFSADDGIQDAPVEKIMLAL
jgi:hypothetical protein